VYSRSNNSCTESPQGFILWAEPHILQKRDNPITLAWNYRLLEAQKAENNGAWPETVAVVLWGTDNIKTYGESLAQVLMMVGINPVSDALGRVNKLEVGVEAS